DEVNGNWVLSPENLRFAGPQVVSGSISSEGSQLRSHCHVSSSQDPLSFLTNHPTWIGGTGDSDESFLGNIAEILVYDRVLSEAEHNSVLGYLNSRYNVPISAGIDSDEDGIFDECDTDAVYLKSPEITVDLIHPNALPGDDGNSLIPNI